MAYRRTARRGRKVSRRNRRNTKRRQNRRLIGGGESWVDNCEKSGFCEKDAEGVYPEEKLQEMINNIIELSEDEDKRSLTIPDLGKQEIGDLSQCKRGIQAMIYLYKRTHKEGNKFLDELIKLNT